MQKAAKHKEIKHIDTSKVGAISLPSCTHGATMPSHTEVIQSPTASSTGSPSNTLSESCMHMHVHKFFNVTVYYSCAHVVIQNLYASVHMHQKHYQEFIK